MEVNGHKLGRAEISSDGLYTYWCSVCHCEQERQEPFLWTGKEYFEDKECVTKEDGYNI